jgi:hypothetical protein
MKHPGLASLGSVGPLAQSGTATLVGGVIAVATAKINGDSVILATRMTAGGGSGFLDTVGTTPPVNGDPGTFEINSSAGTDTSQLAWLVLQSLVRPGQRSPHAPNGLSGTKPLIQHSQDTLVGGSVSLDFEVDADSIAYVQRRTQGSNPGNLTAVVNTGTGQVDVDSDDPGDDAAIDVLVFDQRELLQASAGQLGTPSAGGAGGGALGAITSGALSPSYTDATLNIPIGAVCLITRLAVGGTPGELRISTLTPGAPGTVTVTSDNALDTSTVAVIVLNPAQLAA